MWCFSCVPSLGAEDPVILLNRDVQVNELVERGCHISSDRTNYWEIQVEGRANDGWRLRRARRMSGQHGQKFVTGSLDDELASRESPVSWESCKEYSNMFTPRYTVWNLCPVKNSQ
jgi:hypothetical protein